MCYSGPGWTGHVAFVEPDAPEFEAPLEEWKRFGPRVCTLSPFTLAQNSLHGSFGMSGDIAAVPPKAATIGPAEVIGAKNRMEIAGITVHGTATAWQRLIARLCYHGPVTPRLPSSIHQELAHRLLHQRIDRPRHRTRLGERLLAYVGNDDVLELLKPRLGELATLAPLPAHCRPAARARSRSNITTVARNYFKGLVGPGQVVPSRVRIGRWVRAA